MSTRAEIQSMADRLISTLTTTMPSDKADAIVMDVAKELYCNVLGIEGEIVATTTGFMHGSFGNGKRAIHLAEYKFKPKAIND